MREKIAIVTGGNSGIGRGIVHRFVRAGATAVIVGRDERKGQTVLDEVREMGGEGVFYAHDLSVETEVAALMDAVERRFGRVDVLVNNAGVGSRRGGVQAGDPPGVRWAKMRGPNLDAAYFMSAYALPLLARGRNGAVVNISSTATLHGNWGAYGIAKAAIEALTRSFAAEGAPHGIRVNCVSPGWIATEQDRQTSAAGSEDGAWDLPPSLFNRMGSVDEIANVVFFLASDQASFVTGQTLIVDGGLTITDYPSIPMLKRVGDGLFSKWRRADQSAD